jgi:hypothetical protein
LELFHTLTSRVSISSCTGSNGFKPPSKPILSDDISDMYKSGNSDGLQCGFDSRKGQDLCLLHSVQNGPWVHPASFSMGIRGGGLLPRGQSGKGVKLTTHPHLINNGGTKLLPPHTSYETQRRLCFYRLALPLSALLEFVGLKWIE